MKKRLLITGIMSLGLCTTTIAQDKVVVIPLNSSKVAGTDGQIQYNNGGKSAGAEVYYDNTTGNVGIGTESPSSKLEVRGEIRSTDISGNNRLWGKGRPNIDVATAWTTVPSNSNIEYSHSAGVASWYGVESECPSNTWVCSTSDIPVPDTLIAVTNTDSIECNGAAGTNLAAFVSDSYNSTLGGARWTNIYVGVAKCQQIRVWCCRETVIP